MQLSGQRVVVVGAGRSGRAAVELLLSRGARVTLADRAETIEGRDGFTSRGVSLATGADYGRVLPTADLLVLSPGVSLREPSVPRVPGRLERAA